MLVDALANLRPPGATESTVLGPFYVPGAPEHGYGQDIAVEPAGLPTWVHGRVLDLDGEPIAGAELDVWQNGDDRLYAVQKPEGARGPLARAVHDPRRRLLRLPRGAPGAVPDPRRRPGRGGCSTRPAGTRGARRTST